MNKKIVEEMCLDRENVVYHFFSECLRENILQERLLVSKDECTPEEACVEAVPIPQSEMHTFDEMWGWYEPLIRQE